MYLSVKNFKDLSDIAARRHPWISRQVTCHAPVGVQKRKIELILGIDAAKLVRKGPPNQIGMRSQFVFDGTRDIVSIGKNAVFPVGTR